MFKNLHDSTWNPSSLEIVTTFISLDVPFRFRTTGSCCLGRYGTLIEPELKEFRYRYDHLWRMKLYRIEYLLYRR